MWAMRGEKKNYHVNSNSFFIFHFKCHDTHKLLNVFLSTTHRQCHTVKFTISLSVFFCKKLNSLIFQVCITVWLFCIVNKYKQSNEIVEKPLLEALAATWHFYAGCCIHNDNQTTRFNISCNFFTASLLNIYRNHCELHSNIIYKYIGIQTLRKRQTRKKEITKKTYCYLGCWHTFI